MCDIMAPTSILSRDECLFALEHHFGTDNFEFVSYKERKISDDPMGLLGDHFSVVVTVLLQGQNCELHFFIKTLPANNNQVKLIEQTGVFRKEIMFYSVFLNELKSFGLLHQESSDYLEQCVRSSKQSNKVWSCQFYIMRPDAMVLQDLVKAGFRGLNPRDVLDFQHSVLVLKKLAIFHASSLALEEKHTEKSGQPYRINQVYPDLTEETFYSVKANHPGLELMNTTIQALTRIAKLLPLCKSPEIERIIDERLPKQLRDMMELVKSSKVYRNVLCHADLWTNNILFRYGDDGHPTDARLIDFQLVRYAPPTHDIFTLLHLVTRRALREEYLEELLSIYYMAFSKELRSQGLNSDNILNWSEFRASCGEQQRCGLIQACHCLHFVTIDRDILRKIMKNPELYERTLLHGREDLVYDQFVSDSEYRERMTEVLTELIECYVLDK